MRLGVVFVLGAALVAAVAAESVNARSTSFGLAATKTCLTRKGLTPTSNPSYPPAMTRAQESETVLGTLPAGASPAFLFLVIGRNANDAAAIRTKLRSTMIPPPTSANSWSSARDNAAWTLVMLSGSTPPASVRSVLTSCLTTGTPPTGKAPALAAKYTRSGLTLCLEQHGAAVSVGTLLQGLSRKLFGYSISSKLLPYAMLVETSTSPNTVDGLGIFVLVGSSGPNAIRLRTTLEHEMHLSSSNAVWRGSRKNVAWTASRHNGTTAAGIASGKKLLLGCAA